MGLSKIRVCRQSACAPLFLESLTRGGSTLQKTMKKRGGRGTTSAERGWAERVSTDSSLVARSSPHDNMADGGAGSKDAFRIPVTGEELTYPFFSQFVVRYGHTAKLSTSAAALTGMYAELPPSLEVIFAAGCRCYRSLYLQAAGLIL